MYYMMRCPHCGKGLKADLAAIGKKVSCPACKQPFVHPEATELSVRQQQGDREQLDRAAAARKAAAAARDRLDRGVSPIVAATVLLALVGGGAGLYRYLNAPEAISATAEHARPQPTAESTALRMKWTPDVQQSTGVRPAPTPGGARPAVSQNAAAAHRDADSATPPPNRATSNSAGS